MWRYSVGVLVLLIVASVSIHAQQSKNEKNDAVLSVVPLTKNVYQHISYLQTQDFGLVDCNGLIYINGNEAIICDTPADEKQSHQLLSWMKTHHPQVKIKAVVVNHFHADCLAGLKVFHDAGTTSYAHQLTPELLRSREEKPEIPQHLISTSIELPVGTEKVIVQYFGEAHTRDNIITWVPSEHVIFGGCVLKAMKAGKGNLADANVKEWSNTVGRIKENFSTAKIVVPGHGKPGGVDLLDFTIKLFEEDRAK
jgi:metallo-beta-lactamase class B